MTTNEPDEMEAAHFTAFGGLGIRAQANDRAVLVQLASRLRRFIAPPGEDAEDADVRFDFQQVAARQSHAIRPPSGPLRPVYDPPKGAVLYAPASDELYIDCDDRVRLLCTPRLREVRVSYRTEPHDTWLAAHPFFTLALVEMLKRRERYSLHAAGLSIDGRGLLLAGESGAGKSTLAVGLLRAGFEFLGDDTCFLTPHMDGVRVCAFPDEVDLTEDTIGLFAELSDTPLPGAGHTSKRQLLPELVYAMRFADECTPRLILFPSVAHSDRSVLRPLDPTEALLRLAPNVLLTDAASSQAHLDMLAALVRQSECYALDTGRDFPRLAEELRTLLCSLP
jgi:hypothetical protein